MNKKVIRISFIVDETVFFLPRWLNEAIGKIDKKYQVVGITPLITHGKQTFYSYLYQNIAKIGFLSILKLVATCSLIYIKKTLFLLGFSSIPMSVSQVAQKYNLKVVKTEDVNSPAYLSNLKKLEPDIIISSCSQIFKNELLDLPKIGCINRHSGLLPSYGGVFPVFFAMINEEKYIGVTVHRMVQTIDAGLVLYQKKIAVSKNDTLFSLYKKAYDESVIVTLSALDVISGFQKPLVLAKGKSSYYSFPKKADWDRFRELELKFM